MKRKWFLLFITTLVLFAMAACQTTTTVNDKVILPNLINTSKASALSILSSYPLIIVTEDIVTNDVPAGRFVGYKDGLTPGVEVEKNQTITLLFAVADRMLPDLTGVEKNQIYARLSHLNIILRFEYELSDSFLPDQFIRYSNRQIGDEVSPNQEVVVILAKVETTIQTNLMFTVMLEGTSYNRALEIYNHTDHDVSLSSYSIGFYLDGSETKNHSLSLTGTLSSKESFVIVHELASSDLLAKADLIVPDLMFNGNDTITLEYQNQFIIDQIGVLGWGFTYLADQTMVRKPSALAPNASFSIQHWDQYAQDYDQVFRSYPLTFPTTFTFVEADLSIPFSSPRGMVQVSFVSNNDGDTAQFTPGFTFDNRVRFIGVDTPEMSSGDPVAQAAQRFVNNRLRNAKTIYLQHDPVSGNVETYQRYLALIWVDGVLLNYELVYYGYSQNNYQDPRQRLVFNGVTLARWMTNAENRAKEQRVGVWA